jgi:hypothetical protein
VLAVVAAGLLKKEPTLIGVPTGSVTHSKPVSWSRPSLMSTFSGCSWPWTAPWEWQWATAATICSNQKSATEVGEVGALLVRPGGGSSAALSSPPPTKSKNSPPSHSSRTTQTRPPCVGFVRSRIRLMFGCSGGDGPRTALTSKSLITTGYPPGFAPELEYTPRWVSPILPCARARCAPLPRRWSGPAASEAVRKLTRLLFLCKNCRFFSA